MQRNISTLSRLGVSFCPSALLCPPLALLAIVDSVRVGSGFRSRSRSRNSRDRCATLANGHPRPRLRAHCLLESQLPVCTRALARCEINFQREESDVKQTIRQQRCAITTNTANRNIVAKFIQIFNCNLFFFNFSFTYFYCSRKRRKKNGRIRYVSSDTHKIQS